MFKPTFDPQDATHAFAQARSLEKAGQWLAAEQAYRALLAQQPGHSGAQLQRATVLQRLGRPQEALASLDALLALDPQHALAHCNRGALLQLQGNAEAAQWAYQQALQSNPQLSQAAANWVGLLAHAGQLQRAMQVMHISLQADPDNPALHYHWAGLLRQWGQYQGAVDLLRALLHRNPQHANAWLDLGGLLMLQGRPAVAQRCYARLLRLQPQNRLALFNLGQALEEQGDAAAALQAYEAAQALDASDARLAYHLEFLRLTVCDWRDYHHRMARLQASLAAHTEQLGAPALAPLRLLSLPLPLDLQRRVTQQWASSIEQAVAALAKPSESRTPVARPVIRVGYLSADFRNHAMGGLIHGLFRHHDRTRFQVFAYSLVDESDAYTESIQQGVDHFHSVAADSAQAIAQRIRADGIDVLIDLMGYTHLSRPEVLALRAAPIQLHYLGYPGVLAAGFIDGVIADDWLIPAHPQAPHLQTHYREPVHRLPSAFVASPLPAGEVSSAPAPSRADLGLPATGMVYACFQRPHKLDPHTFALWMQVLLAVPGSVLWLVQQDPLVQTRLREAATAAGVQASRLVFSAAVPTAQFSALCALADLMLDTTHYGAGATGVAALRAGLPLLTCPGDSFASRMGASLCAATGLHELICESSSAYRDKAVELGLGPGALASYRQRLLEQGSQLPLFQTAAWVQSLEVLLVSLVHDA